MRRGTLILVLSFVAVACGGDTAATPSSATTTSAATTTAAPTTVGEAPTTTTEPPPLIDPRFPETNLSARFALPVDAPVAPGFPPHLLLALFYRSVDGPLVVVITGFDESIPSAEQCGWVLIRYGSSAVLAVADWEEAPWDSFANQPWATTAGLTAPPCDAEFLEDGALRSDVAIAQECGDYLVVVADQMPLIPSDLGAEVGSPFVELLVAVADATVELQAVPWVAHPGAAPNLADLVEIDPAALSCP